VSVAKTFFLAHNKVVGKVSEKQMFPKNKRLDRSRMTVGRPIP